MQYSYIPLLKKSEKLPLGFMLKCIFLFVIVYYLYVALNKEEDLLLNLFYQIKTLFKGEYAVILIILLGLVPINWAVEALKWQILSSKIFKQSFIQSFIGVLSGLSMGFIIPQSVGEFTGRILQIKNDRRSELIGAILLGSFLQCLVSLLFGLYGLILLVDTFNNFLTASNNLILLSICFTSILIIFYTLKNKSFKFDFPQPVKFWLHKYLGIITSYSKIEIFYVASLSLFRYIIFTSQFIIILFLFKIDLPLHILFAGVSWVFAAKTIIPAFNFLSDIGVREFSALLFFNQFQIDVAVIITASLFMWAINILIPTIAGSLFVFRMRIFKK